MRRNSHYYTSSIIQKHIVSQIQRYFFTCEWMNQICSGEHAFFFCICRRADNFTLILNIFYKLPAFRFGFASFYQFTNNRMFRSNNHITNAKNCIGSRGVYSEFLIHSVYLKSYLRSFASADPVSLHGFNLIRPSAELINIIQKPLSIICYFKEPLFQILFPNFTFTAFTLAVNNLLISQHCFA